MDLCEEIQYNFNNGYTGKAMKIKTLPDEWPAWTVKETEWYGVIVPVNKGTEFFEEFSNAKIRTVADIQTGDLNFDGLILSCEDKLLRNSFAWICTRFVDPGSDGSLREQLINDPEKWWKEWKELLGNSSSNKYAYPEIAELITLEKLLQKGYQASWMGLSGSVHDIESDHGSFEVKSTIKRNGYIITISSPYQLDHGPQTPLELVFCRFESCGEEAQDGISINDMVNRVVALGAPREEIETQLAKKGLERGRPARKQKYRLLEMKFYPVESDFPSVTPSSFVNNEIPKGVVNLNYDVDLSGLDSRPEP